MRGSHLVGIYLHMMHQSIGPGRYQICLANIKIAYISGCKLERTVLGHVRDLSQTITVCSRLFLL